MLLQYNPNAKVGAFMGWFLGLQLSTETPPQEK